MGRHIPEEAGRCLQCSRGCPVGIPANTAIRLPLSHKFGSGDVATGAKTVVEAVAPQAQHPGDHGLCGGAGRFCGGRTARALTGISRKRHGRQPGFGPFPASILWVLW